MNYNYVYRADQNKAGHIIKLLDQTFEFIADGK